MIFPRQMTWMIESTPRLLVHFASLAALGVALGACVVPAARHEEALSAVQVEQAGHRRTQARLHEIEQKLMAAEAALREHEQKLAERDALIANAELETSVAEKERESASELVDQLRGELGRAGDHLKVFAAERGNLATELEAAEARVARLSLAAGNVDQLGRAVRDASVLLGDALAVGEAELELVEGRPVVRLDAARVWTGEGDELAADGKKLVELLSKLASAHPRLRFELSERALGGQASARLRRLVDALAQAGIAADRVVVRVDEGQASPAERKLEIAMQIAER